MKNERGITLITLTVTLIIILILSVTMAVNFAPYESQRKKADFSKDIHSLTEEIEHYYAKNKELPVINRYANVAMLESTKNVNDNDTYYVIDIRALEVELNYGEEFEKILLINEEEKITAEMNFLDVYIVNEKSHTVYYPKGIVFDGEIHYRLNEQYTETTALTTMYIYNKPQLEDFRDSVNNGNTYENTIVMLMENIDLEGNSGDATTWWTPIGLTSKSPFSGIFEGNNHTIENIFIHGQADETNSDFENDDALAFFGYTQNAKIKDLNRIPNLLI